MKNELPKGWIETTLGEIAKWSSGGTPSRSNSNYYGGDIPWIKTGDLNDGFISEASEFITEAGLKNSSAKLFPIGSVAIAMYGATIGKTGIFEIEAATNQACGVGIPTKCSPKFLFYFLKSQKQNFIELGKGGAQPNISQGVIKEYKINLPPLPEQERIVAKLDNLFSHLETAKQGLEKIPVLLKQFRQAVLTQAVTGKLTEGKNWKRVKLEDLIEKSSNGISKRSGKEGEDIIVLRLADFKNALREKGKERKIVLTSKEREIYDLRDQDILVIRVNGSADLAGRFILYKKGLEDESFCDHFIRYRFKNNLNPTFITYVANSGEGRVFLFNSISTSAGQNTINQKSIGSLEFILPSIKEQTEIVRRVEALFSKADAIEAQYKKLKEQIDQLPQAILAKAFRGEV